MDFTVCEIGRNEEGGIIPGKKIGLYTSDFMISPNMEITLKGKKIRIKSIEIRESGEKILITEK